MTDVVSIVIAVEDLPPKFGLPPTMGLVRRMQGGGRGGGARACGGSADGTGCCFKVGTILMLAAELLHLFACVILFRWYGMYNEMMANPQITAEITKIDAMNCDAPGW